MNTLSIPLVAMAGISLYVGFYHLLIYFRRRKNRVDLTFAFLCFAYVFYAAFCASLYNATSVIEGVQWQRLQFIALAFFATFFLWFVSDYTRHKPGIPTYLLSIFYLLAVVVQLVDRSGFTFLVDQPSIKHITLLRVQPITYYEATLGPFTTVQGLMGMVVSTYVLFMGIRYFRRGYKREAMPLILAIGLMYAAGYHDTLVSNEVYDFIYLVEYAYLAVILVMAYSLSTTVVEAALAKEELRKSEERLRSLVETTSDWVWEVDTNGVYTYASPKVRDLLGYEPEEIIGRTPFDLMPADEAERLRAIFEKQALDKKPFEALENIACCKDGRLIILETSGVPFFDENGKLSGYRGIDRDITERKQVEEALRESELRFRLFVEQSSDGLVFTDEQGMIIEWNQAQEHLSGFLREESIGRPLWELQPDLLPASMQTPELRSKLKQNILFALQYGRADFLDKPTEVVLLRRDGTKVFVQQMAFGIKTNHGYRLGAIVRDITARKQIEEALLESERRHRALVESQIDLISRYLPDTTLTFVNDAYCKFYGKTREELIGRSYLFMIAPEFREQVANEAKQLAEENGTVTGEYINYRYDGKQCWIQWVVKCISDESGHVIELQAVGRDITPLKQVEAEREQLITELESKNAELERFTYTVSHDLKSPLITIRGFLGYIEQDIRSGDINRLKGDTQRIIAATDKMQRLLNELLELSRIGRLMNPPGNIALADLIQEAVKLMEGRLQEKNIEVKIQEDLPVLFGDSQRLSEVIQNLLDNAVKFMGGQTRPVIEIGTRGEENGMPVIYVRDNGMGIASEHHERIFGLFNKLDPRAEGTGAGLAIVKRIIEIHGGRICVESEPGNGATFYFTFPGSEGFDSASRKV
ncbi:MAG: PAS domain S-box protein [Chloroflexi bacterium]|nr:MAG: PAS domain S-box protein [Chloroflexota bacterium]